MWNSHCIEAVSVCHSSKCKKCFSRPVFRSFSCVNRLEASVSIVVPTFNPSVNSNVNRPTKIIEQTNHRPAWDGHASKQSNTFQSTASVIKSTHNCFDIPEHSLAGRRYGSCLSLASWHSPATTYLVSFWICKRVSAFEKFKVLNVQSERTPFKKCSLTRWKSLKVTESR